jgi:threonine/homoserine/homoserine lactone efflux protein
MNDIFTFPLISAIFLFTLSTTLTPGPNNIMLLTSGLNFGFRKTLWHMFGIIIGFPLMVVVIGLGLGIVFKQFPFVFNVLKIVSFIYLLWMAQKIATSNSHIKTSNIPKPFTFWQSVIFQWINPKAWVMAIGSISLFVTSKDDSLNQVFLIAFIYFLSSFLSTSTWTLSGVILKQFLKNEKFIQIFNITMAIALIVSILPFIFL